MLPVLLLVTLLNGGHWYSGQTATVDLRWNIQPPPTQATALWRLQVGRAILAEGQVSMKGVEDSNEKANQGVIEDAGGDALSQLSLALPEVRVATQALLRVRLIEIHTGRWLDSTTVPIWLYPPPVWLEKQLSRAQERVIDVAYFGPAEDALDTIVESEGFKIRTLPGVDALAIKPPQRVLVSHESMNEIGLAIKLREAARQGCHVIELKPIDPQLSSWVQDGWVTSPIGSGSWTRLHTQTAWATDPRASMWLREVMRAVFVDDVEVRRMDESCYSNSETFMPFRLEA